MTADLEIARAAQVRPISVIAERAGIPEAALEPYGRYKAKISLDFVKQQEGKAGLIKSLFQAPLSMRIMQ